MSTLFIRLRIWLLAKSSIRAQCRGDKILARLAEGPLNPVQREMVHNILDTLRNEDRDQ